MSSRQHRRRRDFDDEVDDFRRSSPRPAYRRLFYPAAEAFNPVVPRSAPVEAAPPVRARVKFFNAARRFGILRAVDGVEYFLPGKVLPAGVGEEELRPATELLVRVAPDKGALPVVTEIVSIQPPAIRTEVGTVRRWDGRWGMIELDVGGQWIYLAARCVAEAGLDPNAVIGARLEVDCAITNKPAAIAVRAITISHTGGAA